MKVIGHTIFTSSNEEKKEVQKKIKVAKEANKIMKKAFISLQKEINSLLKSNGFWYGQDDSIKNWPEMQKPSDRNADQAIIDLFTTANEECFEGMTFTHLFTKDDFTTETKES
jgi:hypothetical protein